MCIYIYIYIYMYTHSGLGGAQPLAGPHDDPALSGAADDLSGGATPGLRYKIPVFSDPAPGKS